MTNFTHKEAAFAAKEFSDRYGLETHVCFLLDDYAFVGIHLNKRCVATYSSNKELQTFLEVCATVAQIEDQARTLEHMEEDDLLPRYPQDETEQEALRDELFVHKLQL